MQRTDEQPTGVAEHEGRVRSGGPRTDHGKGNSSQNATKHGCCSNRLILPNESEEDWNALRQAWMEDYHTPQTHVGRALVYEAALAQWLLLRARRCYHETAQELHEQQADPLQWTDEQQKKMERFGRYQTTHERAFSRALGNLERLRRSRSLEAARVRSAEQRAEELELRRRKDDERERARERRAEEDGVRHARQVEAAQTPAQQLFQGQDHPKKRGKVPVLDQWVEVTMEDGVTKTELFPSNKDLIKAGKAMYPPPELVYRRFHFVNGIPPEYEWTRNAKDAERLKAGGAGVQRMTTDTWLQVIEREEAGGTGHLGPTGVGNLPRPKARGECECEVCVGNGAILEAAESG